MKIQPDQDYRLAHQQTLSEAFTIIGKGVHSGVQFILRVLPAPSGEGICFVRRDITLVDNEIIVDPYSIKLVDDTTTVANAYGVRVVNVAAIIQALLDCCIDNATIVIDGPEVPMPNGCGFEGNCARFRQLIAEAGIRRQVGPKHSIGLPGDAFNVFDTQQRDSP